MISLFVTQWWTSLTSAAQIFASIGIIFSVLMILQFLLTLVGLDFDTDIESDFDADFDMDSDNADVSWLSVRGVAAFFTFFGWTGLVAIQNGLSVTIATIIASIVGMLANILVMSTMRWFVSLTEINNLDISLALNQGAEVYLKIPEAEKGFGKVHITLEGSLREMDAITTGEQSIATGEQVKVVAIKDNSILIVERNEN